jgi:hypothetical protein
VLALLLLAAAVGAFLASCVSPASSIAMGAGIALGILALILLALWAFLCGAGSCALLRLLRNLFLALAAIALAAAIVLFLLLNPCWVALLAIALLFSLAAIVLTGIGTVVGCFP